MYNFSVNLIFFHRKIRNPTWKFVPSWFFRSSSINVKYPHLFQLRSILLNLICSSDRTELEQSRRNSTLLLLFLFFLVKDRVPRTKNACDVVVRDYSRLCKGGGGRQVGRWKLITNSTPQHVRTWQNYFFFSRFWAEILIFGGQILLFIYCFLRNAKTKCI